MLDPKVRKSHPDRYVEWICPFCEYEGKIKRNDQDKVLLDQPEEAEERLLRTIFVCIQGFHKAFKYTLLLFYWWKMATTLKIDRAKKEELDRFVASILLREGIKISLQEALDTMIDYALENEEEIIKRLKGLPPLEEDPAWKALEEPTHWGVKDSSRRVDEYVYGR